MKLREENKLKDKMEFHLDTRHVFYLVLWSIVLSGIIFYTGLFVGQKGQEGVAGFTMNNTLKLKTKKPAVGAGMAEPLLNSWSFVSTLVKHPEQQRLPDAALDAMAGLRETVRKKVRDQDEVERKEIAEKLFSPHAEAPPDPSALLAGSRGLGGRNSTRRPRMGQAPDLSAAVALEVVQATPAAVEKVPVPAVNEVGRQGTNSAHRQSRGDSVEDDELGASFAIQAKAFREKSDAMIFLGYIQQELSRSSYKPFIMPVELPGKGKWYRVRVGTFKSRLAAQKFKKRFEKKLGLETFLVTL